MVDLIDGLVGRNQTEQGVSGRKSSGGAQSSVGFQSVLNDVATEDAQLITINLMANTGRTWKRQWLPDSDHNLPLHPTNKRQEILQRTGGRW